MNTKELVDLALEYGFDYAGPLNVAGLQVLQDVRDACAKNTCGRYNKSWACPPAKTSRPCPPGCVRITRT